MKRCALLLGLAFFWSVAMLGQGTSAPLAATPPMGWNSWDGYGTTVTEADVKANAQWLAEHLKSFGWEYVTVDVRGRRHY